MDYTIHGILQARILERVAFPLHLPNPGIKLESPTLQVDSLPAELPGKLPGNAYLKVLLKSLSNKTQKKSLPECPKVNKLLISGM